MRHYGYAARERRLVNEGSAHEKLSIERAAKRENDIRCKDRARRQWSDEHSWKVAKKSDAHGKTYYTACRGAPSAGYWKGISNRRVRHYKGEIPDGCAYRKCFDYQWKID